MSDLPPNAVPACSIPALVPSRSRLGRRIPVAAGLALLAAAAGPAQLQFAETGNRLPPHNESTTAVVLGDIDGDGDLDVVCGNQGQSRLYLNDGSGTFVDATAERMPAAVIWNHTAALGDVDLDGDLDLVLGTRPDMVLRTSSRLYLNDGAGTFTDVTAARMPRAARDDCETHAVAMGDVDCDGDSDLVLGNCSFGGMLDGAPNQLFLNDGAGTFTDATATHLPTKNGWGLEGHEWNTYAVALGDVDGDGDLDLVFGSGATGFDLVWRMGPNQLLLNDGTGRFTDATAARLPNDSDDTRAVALGDVDGDGDADLVFGNFGDSASQAAERQSRLYLNDGSGTFTDLTPTRLPTVAGHSRASAVALGDVDEDGDLDLIFGNGDYPYDEQNRLYLNDGTGTFTDVTAARLPTDNDATCAAALGDVDADGDLDLVFGNRFSAPNRLPLHLNLLRQLDVPFPVRSGQSYQLYIYARYGPPRTMDAAVVMLSAGTARIPLPPFGTFGLDPALLLLLPPLAIPQPTGLASQVVPVPADPRLVGLTIYAQALLVQEPVGIFLTNVTADQIVQ